MPSDIQSLLDTADQELKRVSQIVAQTLRFHRQSTNARKVTAEELLEPDHSSYQESDYEFANRIASGVSAFRSDRMLWRRRVPGPK